MTIEFIHYNEKLNEVFLANQASNAARSFGIAIFTKHVADNALSLDQAMADLCDVKISERFRQLGRESARLDGEINQNTAELGNLTQVTGILSRDIKDIKLATISVIDTGQRTNELLTFVVSATEENQIANEANSRLLSEINAVAGQLQGSMRMTVEKLEPIAEHIDDQLRRMENLQQGINQNKEISREVRDNTHPKATRKENLKMVALSSIGGTIFGSLLASVLGFWNNPHDGNTAALVVIEKTVVEKPRSRRRPFFLKTKKLGINFFLRPARRFTTAQSVGSPPIKHKRRWTLRRELFRCAFGNKHNCLFVKVGDKNLTTP